MRLVLESVDLKKAIASARFGAFSMKQYGVYGESAIVPAYAVAKYPDRLSVKEGTAIWMQYITASGALVEYGQVKAGDFVLITAASSSVGYAAIGIAKAAIEAAIPIERADQPEEIAEAVVWLCSDSSSFVTGHNLVVDGGYTTQ